MYFKRDMKSLSYKSKMLKCFVAMLLACFNMQICNAQKINVQDFISATWNSNGPRWNYVESLMNSGLDILAIQEAGSNDGISGQLSKPSDNGLRAVPIGLGDRLGDTVLERNSNLGAKEYIWTTGSGTFYMYYYDHRIDNPGPGTRQTTKQNMAIISRQRAKEVIIIPFQTRHDPIDVETENDQTRTFINRPALGIRIANSVFFSIHPEPTRTSNEAPKLITEIQNYMNRPNHSQETWMVMGDFNRTPAQLTNALRGVTIISSEKNTRKSGELDYAVVGGPVGAIRAQLIPFRPNPSDHTPVKFDKLPMRRIRITKF